VAFFQKILKMTQQNVFHEGKWNLLQVAAEGDASPDGLIAYEWKSAKAWKIIAVNLSVSVSQGRVRWTENVFPAPHYTLYDELNDVTYARDGEELRNLGLFIRRDPFQAHVLDVKVAP
jgi:hypothetical protein